jgi:hypothetical protein
MDRLRHLVSLAGQVVAGITKDGHVFEAVGLRPPIVEVGRRHRRAEISRARLHPSMMLV